MLNYKKTNKEILARLMAKENLIVTYDSSAKTASFYLEERVLNLPVMSNVENEIYDWFVAHEVSHALNTPQDEEFYKDVKGNSVLAVYFNITEDARIEKLIKVKYPGTKKDCVKFYKYFSDPSVDFFQIKGVDINSLSLINKINLHFKIGHIVPISFDQEEMEYVDMVDNAKTAQEALDAAKKIYEREKQKQQDQPQEQQGSGGKPKKLKIKVGSKPSSKKGKPLTKEDLSEVEEIEIEHSDEQEEDADDGADNDDGEGEDQQDVSPDEIEIEIEIPFTQQAFDSALSKMFDKENKDSVCLTLDKNDKSIEKIFKGIEDNTKKFVERVNKNLEISEYSKFQNNTKSLVSMLYSQFNMKKKASEYQKTQESNTGKLDMDKLYSYKFNDDIFLKNSVVFEGKNHSLFFLLDWSGSMQGRIQNTFKQALILIEFCRLAKIPYELYAFTNGRDDCYVQDKEYNGIVYTNESVSMIRLLSDNMNKQTHSNTCNFILKSFTSGSPANVMSMNWTPLCGSLLTTVSLLKRFKQRVNCEKTIFCLLTDGGASDQIQGYNSTPANNKILIDKRLNMYKSNSQEDDWKVLVEYLKNSCELYSTIGFFLSGDSTFGSTSGILNSSTKKKDQYTNKFLSDNYFETDEVIGFDRYFFVDEKLFNKFFNNIQKDAYQGISKYSSSSNAVQKAFVRNVENRSIKNMLFLKIFIEQIS